MIFNSQKRYKKTSSNLNNLSILFILFFLSSCLPMGIPEYFSNSSVSNYDNNLIKRYVIKEEKSPTALIITNKNPYNLPIDKYYIKPLGHQYLFLIFPITNIYLQHGLESLLIEKLLTSLKTKGYNVLILDKDKINNKNDLSFFNPEIIIRPSLNLSINVYDVFFIRIILIDGVLKIEQFDKNANLIRIFSDRINKKTYRFKAIGPILSKELEKRVTKSINKTLSNLYLKSTFSKKENLSLKNLPLVIKTPILKEDYKDIRKKISDSYGFKNLKPQPKGVIIRLIQRGLKLGASNENIHNYSLISNHNENNDNYWSLETKINKIKIDPPKNTLELALTLTLKEHTKNSPPTLIKRKSLSTKTPIKKTYDASLPLTLELAASTLLKTFLTQL